MDNLSQYSRKYSDGASDFESGSNLGGLPMTHIANQSTYVTDMTNNKNKQSTKVMKVDKSKIKKQ